MNAVVNLYREGKILISNDHPVLDKLKSKYFHRITVNTNVWKNAYYVALNDGGIAILRTTTPKHIVFSNIDAKELKEAVRDNRPVPLLPFTKLVGERTYADALSELLEELY